jgi:hypothetical protein
MQNSNKNDEVFILYGQFLIYFEHVSHMLRFSILYIIFPNYTDKQLRQNEILMEALTADELRTKFMALITEEFDSESEIFKLAKTISNIFLEVIPIRNSFAHGTSFIGKNDLVKESEDGLLILRHPKLRKSGLDLNFKKFEIDTLKLAIQLFKKLQWAISVITVLTIKTEKTQEYDSTEFLKSTRLELSSLGEKLKKN